MLVKRLLRKAAVLVNTLCGGFSKGCLKGKFGGAPGDIVTVEELSTVGVGLFDSPFKLCFKGCFKQFEALSNYIKLYT